MFEPRRIEVTHGPFCRTVKPDCSTTQSIPVIQSPVREGPYSTASSPQSSNTPLLAGCTIVGAPDGGPWAA
jgi:hypothetical protein